MYCTEIKPSVPKEFVNDCSGVVFPGITQHIPETFYINMLSLKLHPGNSVAGLQERVIGRRVWFSETNKH